MEVFGFEKQEIFHNLTKCICKQKIKDISTRQKFKLKKM